LVLDEGKKVLRSFLRLAAVIVLVIAGAFGALFLLIHLSPKPRAQSRPSETGAVELPAMSEEKGFTSLFDGVDLGLWEGEQGLDPWKVKSGAIVATLQTGQTGKWLFSKEDYGDYTLRLEIRLSVGAQCFFAFRADAQHPESTSSDAFLMVQKPPAEPNPRPAAANRNHAEAALDGIFAGRDVDTKTMPPVLVSLKPPDSWNDLELTLQGPWLHVSINGQSIPLRSDPASKRDRSVDRSAWRATVAGHALGRIGFRASQAGEIWLRNIRIKHSSGSHTDRIEGTLR
jgi:hypothetical protein